jgi:PEGA domain-containing protein
VKWFPDRVVKRTIGNGDLQMKTLLRFAAGMALALLTEAACFGQHYTRINLVSNTAGVARVTDLQLINPWGIPDSTAASAALVYFSAGPNKGTGGLFGYLAAVSTEDRVEEASLWSPRSASNIHAHISSTPAGADIQVDGAYVGATPSDIDLTCCWHDVTIIKPGRRPWKRRVRITGGHLNIHAQLQNERGILWRWRDRTLDLRLPHPRISAYS